MGEIFFMLRLGGDCGWSTRMDIRYRIIDPSWPFAQFGVSSGDTYKSSTLLKLTPVNKQAPNIGSFVACLSE